MEVSARTRRAATPPARKVRRALTRGCARAVCVDARVRDEEGVGAGGAAIAAHLYQNWTQEKLLGAIEAQLDDI